MNVSLIGLGCGTAATMTGEAREALAAARLAVGAPRLLRSLPGGLLRPDCEIAAAIRPEEILAAIGRAAGDACVVLSGDSGFYSGTRRLLPLLKGYEVRVLPGISSVQALAARLGRTWQDWALFSAHGVDCDVLSAVCGGRTCFFLTGGELGPADICRVLSEAGLSALPVTVGENLTAANERIISCTAGEAAACSFAPLSVLLTEPAPRFGARAPGLPDELFERSKAVPMTKQEIRAAALSKLAVGPEDVCWDVGAGTGSVSVELALHAKAVWAVERSEEALALARVNREKFGAWNLRLLAGSAPEALEGLPAPDAVFIGGSGGNMEAILRLVHEKNPKARICVTAIALESLHRAAEGMQALGLAVEVAQIAVSRSRPVGGLHLMMAQNPIFLITGVAE